MAKQTSANMQPCKGGAAERHNRREKELEYVRKDLTHLNSYREWTSISQQMDKIRPEYEAATGQKMQSTAQPIQEIVLVIDEDTTPAQVERFCELTRNLGMTPLSYAIHKDEGHWDAETGEWKPNHHAHIIVDTTCWEHRMTERTKKKNGKNVIDPKTHKPVKVMVDAYAKTIKFTREDMSRLQDYAAEATGLERGVSSDRMHEDARQFKAREQAREILAQAETLREQQKQIESQEATIRSSVADMQQQGREIVRTYDAQVGQMEEMDIRPDRELQKRRDWLDQTSNTDMTTKPAGYLLNLLQPLSSAITVLAMAASAMATAMVKSITRTVEERQKTLTALTRQIKGMSIWKSTKSAVLTLLDKPAKRISEMERKIASLSDEKSAVVNQLKASESNLEVAKNTNVSRLEDIRKLQSMVNKDQRTINSWMRDFKQIAEDLVDHSTPEQIQEYESRGLHKSIGVDIWKHAKDTSKERIEQREREQSQGQGRSRGMRL